MRQTGLKIGEAEIGASSDHSSLLEKKNFYWFETNFLSVEYIPFRDDMDSYIEIYNKAGQPALEIEKNILRLRGDFSRLKKTAKDPRFSLFGNLGIFSSWVLRTLEEARDIHTFHACGLVKGSQLLIIPGGAGAGKSVFIFTALSQGWRILSTEFVHFRVNDRITFFKGSLQDAVRVDTFKDHFPEFAQKMKITLEEEMGGKLLVDLAPFQCSPDQLINPEISLVFPHVEEKRDRLVFHEVKEEEALLRQLFHSASEKIEKGLLLYGQMALPGIDDLPLAEKRKVSLEKFLKKGIIKNSFSWVSGIRDIPKIFDRL
ncbi:MAG: hypothetical protein JW755_02265 [Candidatus Aminicenantes bacterium]|nr:hypothetical protein [Candidatus Aminicenantes bacterium]